MTSTQSLAVIEFLPLLDTRLHSQLSSLNESSVDSLSCISRSSVSTMKAPTPALLRALRAANSPPISHSSTTSLYHRVLTSTKKTTSTSPFLHPSRSFTTSPRPRHPHPASYNYTSASATTTATRRPPTNYAPRSHDRGPKSKEDTQTDFGAMDVFANTPPPATAIDACLPGGFHLSNGVKITEGAGVLLVGGEAFGWRPWDERSGSEQDKAIPGQGAGVAALVNAKGQFDVPPSAWGLLELVWPKPELLIVGVGAGMRPLSKETRERIAGLGIRVDVLDTRNAAAQFNLLATERGVGTIAAAMVPLGWRS